MPQIGDLLGSKALASLGIQQDNKSETDRGEPKTSQPNYFIDRVELPEYTPEAARIGLELVKSEKVEAKGKDNPLELAIRKLLDKAYNKEKDGTKVFNKVIFGHLLNLLYGRLVGDISRDEMDIKSTSLSTFCQELLEIAEKMGIHSDFINEFTVRANNKSIGIGRGVEKGGKKAAEKWTTPFTGGR